MKTKETGLDLVSVKNEINKHISDKETFVVLLATTFKGLEASSAKRAMLEGAMRGYQFTDFLEKNVYAIPFKEGYSLVTSIDYARKIGMRSGVVGKSAPTFETENGKVVSCTITIKRLVSEHVGEYSATVFFSEYYKAGYQGRPSLWDTKPRTMIAKVAEMHALRMACPEELSQAYVEEERQNEVVVLTPVDNTSYEAKVRACKTTEELRKVWLDIPPAVKETLKKVKDEMKSILDTEEVQVETGKEEVIV